MKKIIRIGKGQSDNVFCKIEFKDGRLSISGVEGPTSNGDCKGGCGQIVMSMTEEKGYFGRFEFAPGWNLETARKFIQVWDRWHLNDMRAGCEHQQAIDTSKKVTVTRYGWGNLYHDLRRQVAGGTDAEAGAQLGAKIAQINKVFKAIDLAGYTSTGQHVWPDEAKILFAEGFIELDKTEEKAVGWTTEREHPEGMLSRPCPTCGWKYGNGWRLEPVPADVIEFLNSLPDTDTKPAWV